MTASYESKPLRIVYVWDGDYPWDVRTEKICLALTRAGHDVHIVARNKAWQATTERLPEGTVHRMAPWRFIGRKADTALGFPAFFSPRWRSLIAKTVRDVGGDLIVVRDIPLCPTAISVGRTCAVPVVLDMAENYPAMMRDIWTAKRHHASDYLVRNPHLTTRVEAYCVKRVDHIITVVEAASQRLRSLGVPDEKLTVISNTPSLTRTHNKPAVPSATSDSPVRVGYLGLLEVPRGIMELIEAIKLLHDAGHTEFQALIVGDGRDDAMFHKRARDLGLSTSAVRFFGRLPYADALSVVASTDIGIIPHHATESWNTTIPNKLFDYMSLGIPVVSSDAKPCVDVLLETGAGGIFRSGDVASMAAALLEYSSPRCRATAGQAGLEAVRTRYNWEADSATLTRLIDRLCQPDVERMKVLT